MSKSNRYLFSIIALITILACTMPGGITTTAGPDFVATITAQAALLIQPPVNIQPSLQPSIASETPAPPAPPANTQIVSTETPSPTASITLTSTSSVPMVTVSKDTNCRTGPGKEYDYLGALLIGETAEVIGKNTVTDYWIIKNPDREGNCWLWGNYATVTGDVSKLQESAIPPTPTPAPPEAPKGLSANKICFFNGVNYDLGGFVSWNDGASETGYNVYMNDVLLVSLPANSTSNPLPAMVMVPGGSIQISVEAFNSSGKSAKKSIQVTCP